MCLSVCLLVYLRVYQFVCFCVCLFVFCCLCVTCYFVIHFFVFYSVFSYTEHAAKKARTCCKEACTVLLLLRDKSIALSVTAYSLYAFVTIISNEVSDV